METLTNPTTTKTCECGCEALVRRNFLPGHDARLKGRLINECRSANWWTRETAAHMLLNRGWGHFIPAETIETALPTRSRHAGRFHETRHINEVGGWHTDEAGIAHAFTTCRAIEGNTTRTDDQDGFACSTCIHTADINERIANARRTAWVMDEPTIQFAGEAA